MLGIQLEGPLRRLLRRRVIAHRQVGPGQLGLDGCRLWIGGRRLLEKRDGHVEAVLSLGHLRHGVVEVGLGAVGGLDPHDLGQGRLGGRHGRQPETGGRRQQSARGNEVELIGVAVQGESHPLDPLG